MGVFKTSRYVTYKGELRTVKEVADLEGVPYQRLWDRLFKLGWDLERAIQTPVAKHRRRRTTSAASVKTRIEKHNQDVKKRERANLTLATVWGGFNTGTR